ncbi:MAG: terpene cyclase/mutase family protein, partial [Planctomycetota bacterium]|nr:terpene cyclase/mutase family protein [Planctomycetota bacterium]
VDKALEWLARHQEADGSWSVRKTEGRGSGGSIDWDPGLTGLATLAFLGAGHTEKVGKYKETVRKAIAWMISQQNADGAIGADPKWREHHGGFGYHHAICGMALAEASAMGREPKTKEAAQKAVTYTCEKYQYGDGSDKLGFRYSPKAAVGDVSVTGWYIMQLKSAKIAGLHVDPASFEGALKFLDSREQDPAKVKKEDDGYDTGRHRYGYTERGAMVNTTSIGILCRLYLGAKPEEVHGAALWLLRTNAPAWKADLGVANGGGWPMYYMYYTTLTMFQTGGDVWKEWNTALKQTLLNNQRKDGDADGSWDPLSDWEKNAGRAYTTALGAMCLEVYYRYMPLYRDH